MTTRDALEPEIPRPVASRALEASGAPPAGTGRYANTGLVIVFLSLAGLSYARAAVVGGAGAA